jgi:hypothetical protein
MAQKDLLEAVFNNLVLPSQITLNTARPPQKVVEDDVGTVNENLADRLLAACEELAESTSLDRSVWDALACAINETRRANRDLLSHQSVQFALTHVRDSLDERSWLALHIASQNASLIVHKDTE